VNKVHQLPDSMQRQWRVFEGKLREWLATDAGCTAAEIDHACAQLKPLYLQFAQPKTFSGDPEEVLLGLNSWVQTQLIGLMQVISVRDIELYRLRGGDE